jgi:predicted nuclease with TOPRIM domain
MLNQVFRGRALMFRTRSPDRDRQSDAANVALIAKAINEALMAAEFERAGLARRVADVLSRAAVTVGNDVDEYIDRDDRDTNHLNRMDAEIQSGQDRLKQLDHNIAQFEALRVELALKFPDVVVEAM